MKKRVGRPAKKKKHQTSTPPTEVSVTALSDLTDSPLSSNQWIIQNHSPDNVIICKMSSQLSSDRHSPSVTHCLTINSDFSWTLSVHGMKIDAHVCPLLSKISTKLSTYNSCCLCSIVLWFVLVIRMNSSWKWPRPKKATSYQGMVRQ